MKLRYFICLSVLFVTPAEADPDDDLIYLHEVMNGIQSGQLAGLEQSLNQIEDDELRSVWAANAVSNAIQNDQASLAVGFLDQIHDKDLRNIWAANTVLNLIENEDCVSAKAAVSKIRDFALSTIWKGKIAVLCGQLSKQKLEKRAEDLQGSVESFAQETQERVRNVFEDVKHSNVLPNTEQNKIALYWKGVDPPENSPPTNLHIEELYPTNSKEISSHPEIFEDVIEPLHVKVQKVESDDSLTLRLMPHHETPWCCGREKQTLAYDAKDFEARACWSLSDQAFMSLSEWKDRVKTNNRKRYTWCLVSDEKRSLGWVNSHFLDLGDGEGTAKVASYTGQTIKEKVQQETVKDPWAAIDTWIVIEHPKRMKIVERYWNKLTKKAEFYSLSEAEELQVISLSFGGGHNASFKHIDVAIELFDANPDWTTEDVVIELQTLEKEHFGKLKHGRTTYGANVDSMFGLDFGINRQVVSSIRALKLNKDRLKERRKYIIDFMEKCLANFDDMRPSERPEDPKNHCVNRIVDRDL